MSFLRILNSIKADIKFQFKHGFYVVYVVLCILYIIVLNFIPPHVKGIVLSILIYSDPAALGLFFIGGMVLLEKEQGVLSLLYITPLKVYEYIISKVLTLGIISTLVAIAISIASSNVPVNYAFLILGTFLVSVFFTLIGFLIASRSKTVNDYIVKMIPYMLLAILPCFALIPSSKIPQFIRKIALFIPSAGGLKMIFASFSGASPLDITISISGLIIVNVLLVKLVHRVFTHKMITNA